MAKEQILEKLANKLKTVPASESDVVYILSRIRKVLEINNYPEIYKTLKFYCDWALHIKIDRLPKSTSDMLVRIKDGGTNPKAYLNSMIGFEDLHQQLENFLKEYNLSNIIYTEEYGVKKFNKLLLDIYSNTPILLTINKEKFKIIISENDGNFCLDQTQN